MRATVIVLAQSLVLARSNHVFAQSTSVHTMAPTYTWTELLLVALGVLAVVLTMGYTLLCFVRPGEMGENHVKRRILHDGCE
jgi:hypothetical protein